MLIGHCVCLPLPKVFLKLGYFSAGLDVRSDTLIEMGSYRSMQLSNIGRYGAYLGALSRGPTACA